MADDALLSDLCSICNTAKFKYRCPACSARTCSLPCYKRHQQWAQCNGKRDPAKFVKKSQLATAAGIDHDYNFLTSIERQLERAEKHVGSRSLGSPSDPRRNANVRAPSDQHLALAGVTVVRAPKGLSRQKENKTHRNKSRNTVWTVEWIYEDSTRILNATSSAQSILKSQPFRKDSKREATRKRKRAGDQSTATTESGQQHVSPPIKAEEGVPKVKAEHTQPDHTPVSGPEPERDNLGATPRDTTASDTTAPQDHEVKSAKDHHGSICVDGSKPESVPPEYAFYLLRPRTSSNRHVLIRLDPTVTLGECLRGQTVLEFPTIYVFLTSTTPPPERFMLEADYVQQESEEQKEYEDLLEHVSPETLLALKEEQEGCGDNASDEIDSAKILDVLKQDIGARV